MKVNSTQVRLEMGHPVSAGLLVELNPLFGSTNNGSGCFHSMVVVHFSCLWFNTPHGLVFNGQNRGTSMRFRLSSEYLQLNVTRLVAFSDRQKKSSY